MRRRWKLNEAAAATLGGLWLVVGLVAFLTVALATPRHSLATRVVALVWFVPMALALLGFLLAMFPEIFEGMRPRLGLPFRRVREPVVEDSPEQRDWLEFRPEAASAVAGLRRRYLAGEIEVDDLEDGVERALVGRASAADEAFAEQLATDRRVMSDWLRRQHDLALGRGGG